MKRKDNEIKSGKKQTVLTIKSPKYGDTKYLIDAEDLDRINVYRWTMQINKKQTYAVTYVNGKMTTLHRYIMNAVDADYNTVVDHIDGNSLDCRKSNLRVCSRRENSLNKSATKRLEGELSTIKYVYKEKDFYRVRIGKTSKYFKVLSEAVTYANELSKHIYGEFAITQEVK